jgi:parvulin-like peptidyl-prolyl isomerase
MKRLLGVALAVCAACSGGKQAASPAPAASPATVPPPIDATTPLPEPLPKIAAMVNGNPIKTPYVEIIANGILEPAGNQPKDRPFAYRRALQQLIVRELLFEEAVARRLSADDARVEQAYNEARVGHKDDAKWLQYLAAQYMDADTFRQELRAQQTIAKMLAQESERIPSSVSEEEAKAYYDAHPELFDSGERRVVRYILLRVPPGAPREQKVQIHSKLQVLRQRIAKGEDFAKLAEQFSQDQASAGNGGLLAVFGRGQMEPSFEKAAYALGKGELSAVVETPFGYNLLRVEEILPARKLAFEGLKDAIKQQVLKDQRDKRAQELIAKLWAQARIETYL